MAFVAISWIRYRMLNHAILLSWSLSWTPQVTLYAESFNERLRCGFTIMNQNFWNLYQVRESFIWIRALFSAAYSFPVDKIFSKNKVTFLLEDVSHFVGGITENCIINSFIIPTIHQPLSGV
jgi:hypothetical protein